jgi:hypothetical protein
MRHVATHDLVFRYANNARYYYGALWRSLDAGGRAFVQKVFEKETIEFYKRDRAGTGGAGRERVSSSFLSSNLDVATLCYFF